jgi:hypothetical protein
VPEEARIITPEDLLPLEEYERVRQDLLAENRARKRRRQIAVGPHATFSFENWQTMRSQIQEMLRVEKGGADQLSDELEAYNPMIPNGRELTATLMLEIEDENERRLFLSRLGGVEDHTYIAIDGEQIKAVPEGDVERSTPEGKASAVQFLHFPFDAGRIVGFGDYSAVINLGIDHRAYSFNVVIPDELRQELLADFADP